MNPPGVAARLPQVGAELALRISGGVEQRMRVVTAGEGWLGLAWQGSVPEPSQADPRDADAFVEYAVSEGICQLPGLVVGLASESALLQFTHDAHVELLHRRAFVRAPMALSVTLVSADRGGLASRLRTIDVSGGGMLVAGDGRASVGELMEFSLIIGLDEPICGECRVVRQTPGGDVALHIVTIAATDRDRLVHGVFRRQRELRGRT